MCEKLSRTPASVGWRREILKPIGQ
nr:hypothetical protein [Yersinia enterocolitica]